MTANRYIIWDWNGTLLDDLEAAVGALNRMLISRHCKPISLSQYRAEFGFPVRPFYAKRGVDLAHEDWNKLCRDFHDYYAEEPGQRIRPDARQVLETLRAAGYRQVILSALREDLLKENLTRYELLDYFDAVAGTYNLDGASKLSRGEILFATLPPGEKIFIGDTLHDAEVAEHFGGTCIFLGCGHQAPSRLALTGWPIAETLAEIPRILASNIQRQPHLTLVIPCYNETHRFDKAAYHDALSAMPGLSILFVNDGSTDATGTMLDAFAASEPRVRVMHMNQNVGKGETVRTGILACLANATTDYIGFWDVDLATPFSLLPDFLANFTRNAAGVIGVRHRGGAIKRTPYRRLTAAIMRFLIRLFSGVHTGDTQCGAKLFTRQGAEIAFRQPFRTHWLFDVEIVQRLGNAVTECPLRQWRDMPGSKLNMRESFRILRELPKCRR